MVPLPPVSLPTPLGFGDTPRHEVPFFVEDRDPLTHVGAELNVPELAHALSGVDPLLDIAYVYYPCDKYQLLYRLKPHKRSGVPAVSVPLEPLPDLGPFVITADKHGYYVCPFRSCRVCCPTEDALVGHAAESHFDDMGERVSNVWMKLHFPGRCPGKVRPKHQPLVAEVVRVEAIE